MTTLPQIIPGFHGVMDSLLKNSASIREIRIAKGKKSKRLAEIIRVARKQHIPVITQNISEFSMSFPDMAHQGVVALLKDFSYTELDALVKKASEKPGRSILIAADHITDEGNLGSIMRTVAFFGAHGLIIPKDRSAGISARVLKSAAGAHNHLPVARVVNLGSSLKKMNKQGFWIIGTSTQGVSVFQFDWDRDIVLVLGNEQKGLGPSIRRLCHETVNVPSPGQVESLNVAVAGGVIMSEILRQRLASYKLSENKVTDRP